MLTTKVVLKESKLHIQSIIFEECGILKNWLRGSKYRALLHILSDALKSWATFQELWNLLPLECMPCSI